MDNKIISLENLNQYNEKIKDYIDEKTAKPLSVNAVLNTSDNKVNSITLSAEGVKNNKIKSVVINDGESEVSIDNITIETLNKNNTADVNYTVDYSTKVDAAEEHKSDSGSSIQNYLDKNLSKFAWCKLNTDGTDNMGAYFDKETIEKVYNYWGVTFDKENSKVTGTGSFGWQYYVAPNGNVYQFNAYGAGAKLEFGKGAGTHQVGKKLPNEYGIFDMTGNIEEYVKNADGSYTTIGGSAQPGTDAGNPSKALLIERDAAVASKVAKEFKGIRVVKTHGETTPEGFVNVGDIDMAVYTVTKKDYKETMPETIEDVDFNQEPSFWVSGKEFTKEGCFNGEFDTDGITPLFTHTATGTYELLDGEVDELRPVDSVTEFDAMLYCNMLSTTKGLDTFYTLSDITIEEGHITSATVAENDNEGFRLPTIEEWKTVAHGSKNTMYSGCNPTVENVAGGYPYFIAPYTVEAEVPEIVVKYVFEDDLEKVVTFVKEAAPITREEIEQMIQDNIPEGSDAVLTKDITTNIDIGAIAKNTKLVKDMTFTEFVEKLSVKYVEPTATISLNKTISEKWNPVESVKITYTATANNPDTTITDIKIYAGSTEISSATSNGDYTYSPADAIGTTTTFKVVATDSNGHTATATANLNIVLPYYYGVSASADLTDVTSLTKLLQTKGNKELTFSPNVQYIYVFYDSTYTLTSITDGSGTVTSNFTKLDTIKITADDGKEYSYTGYRSNSEAVLTGYKATFKF